MEDPNAKKWYDYWSLNCKWCRRDGSCEEQEARKERKEDAVNERCEEFLDIEEAE
ncbi:MAG: hypothetical protein ACYSUV_21515 [Planctomycetota bacterium]|jgi:hypothetical protein